LKENTRKNINKVKKESRVFNLIKKSAKGLKITQTGLKGGG